MSGAHQNVDVSDYGSLAGFARQVLEGFLRNEVSSFLPAIVVSYDRARNRAIVAPAIKIVTTDKRQIDRPLLIDVPVFCYGGAGFLVTVPLKKGAKGWIKACDRDISLYLQKGSAAAPNTAQMFSFDSSLFYPDVVDGFTALDDESLFIQNTAGTEFIQLGLDGITVKAAAITLDGAVHITGAVTTGSTINAAGDVNIAGKSFLGHTHHGYPLD